MDKYFQDLEKIKKEIWALSTQLQENAGGDNADLSLQINQIMENLSQLEGQVSENDRQMQLEIDECKSAQDEMAVDLEGVQSSQATMQEEISDCKSQQQSLQTQVDDCKSNQSTLQTKIDGCISGQENLQGQINQVNTTQNSLQSQVNECVSDQTALQADVSKCKSDQVQMQADIDAVEAGHDNLQGQINNLSASIPTECMTIGDTQQCITCGGKTSQGYIDFIVSSTRKLRYVFGVTATTFAVNFPDPFEEVLWISSSYAPTASTNMSCVAFRATIGSISNTQLTFLGSSSTTAYARYGVWGYVSI